MRKFDKASIIEEIKNVCPLYEAMNPQESEIEVYKVSYQDISNEVWIWVKWTNYCNVTRKFALTYDIESNDTQFEEV